MSKDKKKNSGPSSQPPAIDRFHEHRADCRQCQEHPSGRCSEADTLLQEASEENRKRYGDLR